jgi:uncharacterized cupredoxin-like copper-binding protein
VWHNTPPEYPQKDLDQMIRPLTALIAAGTVLVAACGGGSPSTAPTSPPTDAPTAPATAAATPAVPTPGPTAATRIDVQLTDALRIEPADMRVPAGVPVTFVVTNTGALDHEFYLGDEAAQLAHAQEMADMGGMIHDEPEGIGVKPGETKELTYTFPAPGVTLAGCHVNGHYLGGMKATITVE